jgi:hypothetical protein
LATTRQHNSLLTHNLAVEYSAELSPSILARSSWNRLSAFASSLFPLTVCMTEDSWSGPITQIFAFGHMKRKRGEYCVVIAAHDEINRGD